MEEPVRLILGNGQGQTAILQDVSAGGACLRTYQRLRVGERIGVSMNFGFDQRYEMPASVVYAHPSTRGAHARYGVRFVWISGDERYRLDKFVTDRANTRQRGIRTLCN